MQKSDPGGFPGEVTQSSCQLEGGWIREGGEEGVVQLWGIYILHRRTVKCLPCPEAVDTPLLWVTGLRGTWGLSGRYDLGESYSNTEANPISKFPHREG